MVDFQKNMWIIAKIEEKIALGFQYVISIYQRAEQTMNLLLNRFIEVLALVPERSWELKVLFKLYNMLLVKRETTMKELQVIENQNNIRLTIYLSALESKFRANNALLKRLRSQEYRKNKKSELHVIKSTIESVS